MKEGGEGDGEVLEYGSENGRGVTLPTSTSSVVSILGATMATSATITTTNNNPIQAQRCASGNDNRTLQLEYKYWLSKVKVDRDPFEALRYAPCHIRRS